MFLNLKFKKKNEKEFWIFNKKVTKKEWNNRFKIGKGLRE